MGRFTLKRTAPQRQDPETLASTTVPSDDASRAGGCWIAELDELTVAHARPAADDHENIPECRKRGDVLIRAPALAAPSRRVIAKAAEAD